MSTEKPLRGRLWLALFGQSVRLAGTGLLIALLGLAGVATALPDWRRDGRTGYPERLQAEALAKAFTRPGAPYAGKSWRIVRDPDGGFTPVFFDPPRLRDAGS